MKIQEYIINELGEFTIEMPAGAKLLKALVRPIYQNLMVGYPEDEILLIVQVNEKTTKVRKRHFLLVKSDTDLTQYESPLSHLESFLNKETNTLIHLFEVLKGPQRVLEFQPWQPDPPEPLRAR